MEDVSRPRGATTLQRQKWRDSYQRNAERKRQQGREDYARNPERAQAYQRDRYKRVGHGRNRSRNLFARSSRKWAYACVIVYKRQSGCSDCGLDDPRRLEFDHRPEEDKSFTIGVDGRDVSPKRLWEEMEKCDVVCANCHRLRTWDRKYVSLEDWYTAMRV